MSELTNLYLLVFPERRLVKVGKADDLRLRIQQLRREWGEVDYDASYYLRAERSVVFALEKSLLLFLREYNASLVTGDGRTEVFAHEAFELALRHLELFTGSRTHPILLTKGVPKHERPSSRPKHNLLVSERQRWNDLQDMSRQISRLNRWLRVLQRRQHWIAFQFDIVDDRLHFRLQGPPDRISDEFFAPVKLLSHFRWYGAGQDNTYQLDVDLPRDFTVLAEATSSTMQLLRLMPNRSAALVSRDLPLLETHAIAQASLSDH